LLPPSGVDTVAGAPYDRRMQACQRCGEENPAQARFCLACGSSLAVPTTVGEERKVITVVFCDLVGFTARSDQADPEDVGAMLRPYHLRLREEIERFAGTLDKFIGDAVMAVFGAPAAHEDDPERAVRCSLRMLEAIAELNAAHPTLELAVRIGINTGEALVRLGATEDTERVVGDVVNTASRLQGIAPVGGVVVGEATWRATRPLFDFQQLAPARVKGKAQPLRVWRALAPRAKVGLHIAHAPRTMLVGRERELGSLLAALERVRSDRATQFVTLVGVPGIGKSRLVWELLQAVDAEPQLMTWRQGRSLPYGEGIALWALGEIVKAQAGILESDLAGQAAGKLGRAVHDLVADERDATWVADQLRALVGLADRIELGSDRRAEAFAAWRRFLEALAEQRPTLLVFEDLHWADDVLLDFLGYLLERATDVPLLMVATARPELLTRRPGWGGAKPNSAIMSLAPLGELDTARLVVALLDQPVLPAGLQTALLARAGGNPLYVEEYVRMLADRGFVRKLGGTWRLEQADQLPLPETVQGIIAARLDTLSAEDKALVTDAAVLGEVGWLGALATLGKREASSLEERLNILDRREFIRLERHSQVAGERQYSFRHILVRDVAYNQLPRGARADKHRRAAEWIESLAPDRAQDRAELLAHHYLAALRFAHAAGQENDSLVQRAYLALRAAGDRAMGLNSFPTAVRWYVAALQYSRATDPERPRLLLRLGQARSHTELGGAEVLAEARDGLLALGDRESAAEAEALIGNVLGWQGQHAREMEHLRRAVALLEETGPSRAKAYVLAQHAHSLMRSAEIEESIRVGQQALAMGEELGLDELRGHALTSIGTARFLGGDPSGVAELEQAVAILLQAKSPHVARAYANLGFTLVELGDLTGGFLAHKKSREATEGFGGDLRYERGEQAFGDYWRGRWDAALEAADELIAASMAGPRHRTETSCRLIRGWIRQARGDLDGALEDVELGLNLAQEQNSPLELYSTLASSARTLLAAGRIEAAESKANQLLTLLRQKLPISSSDWACNLAIVLQALQRGAELHDLLTDVKAPTRWLQAAAAFATSEFEKAAELYREIGSGPDEAFARLRRSEQLLASGRRVEASQHLERALIFYRNVGAKAYLQEGGAMLHASA
jgi:class 3 adenylate cyclase/tetratricopeptide (TPR) repeat protein